MKSWKAKIRRLEKAVEALTAIRQCLYPSESAIAKHLKKLGKGQIRWSDFAPMLSIATGGSVTKFNPYDYQTELIAVIEISSNIICCKSRQLGISETLCSWLLMKAVTEPGFTAVVFNKTGDDASDLGERSRKMALSLGSLCPPFESENKRLVSFKGLGKIYFLDPTVKGRMGIPSASVVVFDEAAFTNNIESMYEAVVATLSMRGVKGKIIFNSTPNGKTGLFWKILSSGKGEADRILKEIDLIRQPEQNDILPFPHCRFWTHQSWTKVLVHWRQHPLYGADPNWLNKIKEETQLTDTHIKQEYDLDFGSDSSAAYLSIESQLPVALE